MMVRINAEDVRREILEDTIGSADGSSKVYLMVGATVSFVQVWVLDAFMLQRDCSLLWINGIHKSCNIMD